VIEVEQKDLKLALKTCAEVAGRGDEIEAFVRLVNFDNQLSLVASNGPLATMRNIECHTSKPVDTCVRADRLKAAVMALRVGKVRLELTERGNLRVQQGAGARVVLDTRPSTEFPQEPGFEGMTQIYSGPNPSDGLKALKHVAVKNTGSQPLSDALLVMNKRSYVVTNAASVRCDFSLANDQDGAFPQAKDPFAVPLASTWLLSDFGEEISCWIDWPGKRVLVVDSAGWGLLRMHHAKIETFPQTVDTAFRHLRELGQVKLNRQETLKAVSAAQTILKGSKEAVLITITCHKEMVELTASAGGQSFSDKIPAKCSGGFIIPVHLPRLRGFLAASADDSVYVKVMGVANQPGTEKHAVHLVDSRLHEIVWLPKDSPIEVVESAEV